jgi:hypothetical protein
MNDHRLGRLRGRLHRPAAPRGQWWGPLCEVGFVVFTYGIALLITALWERWAYGVMLHSVIPAEADYWLARFTLGDAFHLPVTWILATVLAVATWWNGPGPARPASDTTGSADDDASSSSGCCHSHGEMPGR